MQVLTEIYRSPGVNIHGRTVHRTAVRAVVLRDRELLMVHSAVAGDYKFPGGGVRHGEGHRQALGRELREECGMTLVELGRPLGAVIEYDFPVEPDYDVFQMTSHYYRCRLSEETVAQQLDEYERELGLKSVWIDIDQALDANKALLGSPGEPEWLKREIFVLEYLGRGNS